MKADTLKVAKHSLLNYILSKLGLSLEPILDIEDFEDL